MSRAALAAAALALALAWFGTLGLRPLYKADESRYAEIPREMAASGDWITPRLNGLKYFEKPPLQYWTTAVFFKFLGERDWVARLWTAAAGLAGVLLAFFTGKKLFGPAAGFVAAAVLAGSPLYALLGQVNTLDMGLTFFLSAAVFAFALGHMLLFWAACALAVLSKGLIGIVLPGAAVAAYILARRDWGLLRRMRIVPGLLLFLAIAAPWFIAVSLANAEFFDFFFVQEHFQRFTSTMHGRYQPAWYFVPILAVGIAPWVVPLFFSLKASLSGRKSPREFDSALFLALWALVVFAFFSASGSKLPAYILPMFPALAVLIGGWLAAQAARRVLLAQAALAVAAGAAACVLAPGWGEPYPGYVPWIVASALFGAACGIAALAFAWRSAPRAAVVALALAGFGCTQIALAGHRVLAPAFSIADEVAGLKVPPAPGARIFAVDFYDHTIPWYFRRTVTMVRYRDELGKPIEWEPQKFIAELPEFARAWSAAPGAHAVFPAANFEALRNQIGAPMQVVARGPRYVIVRKP